MIKLSDILDQDRFDEHCSESNIRLQTHPEFPELSIANYTEQCSYGRLWDHETRTSRGLIYRNDTFEVLARPFPKFFNHNEPDAELPDPNEPVVVTDKADGSLGILYLRPDGKPAIATRGSFASDQALHATERLSTDVRVPRERTILYEIIYPENRIVLDYGKFDGLIRLGSVDILTGKVYSAVTYSMAQAFDENDIKDVAVFSFPDLPAALSAPPRKNAEGYVVRGLHTDRMVKLKQADYVALHRIVTGLTPLRVWELLSADDGSAEEVRALLPEEFLPWFDEMVDKLFAQFHDILFAAGDLFEANQHHETRKDLALAIKDEPLKGLVFQAVDGRDIAPSIWKMIKPRGDEK